MLTSISNFLSGGIMLVDLFIGLVFLRYRKNTKDRFFALFAVAFFLLSFERVPLLLFFSPSEEADSWVFLIRLLAYTLIIAAIADKNRKRT